MQGIYDGGGGKSESSMCYGDKRGETPKSLCVRGERKEILDLSICL